MKIKTSKNHLFHFPNCAGVVDVMVNSACSSASTESAPAGFPGLTADAVADAVADVSALHSLVPRERPSSADLQFASHGLELQLKGGGI